MTRSPLLSKWSIMYKYEVEQLYFELVLDHLTKDDRESAKTEKFNNINISMCNIGHLYNLNILIITT